jgi:hypothetical protein
MGRRKRTTIAAAILGLTSLIFAAPAGAGVFGQSGWIGLAGGHLGEFEWAVQVKRPDGPAGAGPQGALRPCMLVRTKWDSSPTSFSRSQYRACAGRRGHLSATEPPLFRTGGLEATGHDGAGITAVGMVAAPAVHSAKVELGNGSWRTVSLNRLSRSKAQSAKLGRLSYAAFAVRGVWCSERIVTLDATGRTLWDSGENEFSC